MSLLLFCFFPFIKGARLCRLFFFPFDKGGWCWLFPFPFIKGGLCRLFFFPFKKGAGCSWLPLFPFNKGGLCRLLFFPFSKGAGCCWLPLFPFIKGACLCRLLFFPFSKGAGCCWLPLFPFISSRGPRLANKLLHTYPPPFIFFIFHLLPLFVFIIFLHSFLSISSVFLSSFFQNFRHPFLLPPRLIHFIIYLSKCHFLNLLTSSISKKEILQNILQKIFVIKKIFELSKNDLSISRTKNRTATTSLPPSFHQFHHIFVWGVVA